MQFHKINSPQIKTQKNTGKKISSFKTTIKKTAAKVASLRDEVVKNVKSRQTGSRIKKFKQTVCTELSQAVEDQREGIRELHFDYGASFKGALIGGAFFALMVAGVGLCGGAAIPTIIVWSGILGTLGGVAGFTETLF